MTATRTALAPYHSLHVSAAFLLALFFALFASRAAAVEATVSPSITVPRLTTDAELSPLPTLELRAIPISQLIQRIALDNHVPVIVGLDVPFVPEGDLPDKAAIAAQRAAIAAAQLKLEGDLAPRKLKIKRKYKTIPFMAMTVDASAMAYLDSRKDVVSIEEDSLARPSLASTTQLIGTPTIQNYLYGYSYDGGGYSVAILDTGVDNDHVFLDYIIKEACFSTNDSWAGADSLCPNDGEEQFGSGAADNCSTSIDGCDHGTHVAGIAAGRGNSPVDWYTDDPDLPSFSGVARGASVIAVQVFHRRTGSTCTDNGDSSPCTRTYKSDYVAALEWVYGLRDDYDIAAANLSLGGGEYDRQTTCANNNRATESAVANLRSVRIATVAASGNDGFTDALAAPACLSNVISVGNTRDNDNVNGSSNSASFLTLLAPGTSVDSSVPGDNFASKSGTSMAAPHVTGAWAIMKEAYGNLHVKDIRDLLKDSGVSVTDSRNDITKKRIQLDRAMPIELVVLTPTPAQRTITAGQSATYTISVKRINFGGQIDLQLGQVPPGVTATLSQTTDVGASVTLTLQTTVSTPSLGTKDLRIFASIFPTDEIPADVRLVVNAPTPTVSGMSPTTGPAGTQVTITGTNLIGNINVTFGGVSSPNITRVSNTEIRAMIPGGAISGSVVVTTPGGTRTVPGTFTVTQAPSITNVSPYSGVKGDPITISGFNLSGATAVKFNGVSALAFTVISATKIETTVPIAASTGSVTITTENGTATSPNTFTVLSSSAPPDISSFSPATGDEGTEITVNGSGFTGTLTVKVGSGTAIQVTRISSKKIKVRVPSTATTGKITVTTEHGQALSDTNFTRVLQ